MVSAIFFLKVYCRVFTPPFKKIFLFQNSSKQNNKRNIRGGRHRCDKNSWLQEIIERCVQNSQLNIKLLQLFQKMLSSMNYYVLPCTSYDERNRMNATSNTKQSASISPLLLVLSKALSQSLTQYSLTYYHKQVNNCSSNQQQISNITQKQKTIISTAAEEENHINKVASLIKENKQSNNPVIDDAIKEKGQISTYSITNDEIISQISSEVHNHCKFKTIRKQKKDKIRSGNLNVDIPLPKVTLLQTAQIPALYFQNQQFRKKKQSLWRREVASWTWKSKARNEKREIRMLNR